MNTEKQISYIFSKNDIIKGHSGSYSNSSVAVIGNTVVAEECRNKGVAKNLKKHLFKDIFNKNISHLVAYALLSHDYTQKHYDSSFIPCGLTLSFDDFLSKEDSLYQTNEVNCDIALCKPISSAKIVIPDVSFFQEEIINLYHLLNCEVEIKKTPYSNIYSLEDYLVVDLRDETAQNKIIKANKEDYSFLGIYPSANDGLNILGFASKNLMTKLPRNYKTNSLDREKFVKRLLEK